jgi:hypothetical protein
MSSTTPIKIGFSLSLSGPLAANGQTALLTQKIWEVDVNRKADDFSDVIWINSHSGQRQYPF